MRCGKPRRPHPGHALSESLRTGRHSVGARRSCCLHTHRRPRPYQHRGDRIRGSVCARVDPEARHPRCGGTSQVTSLTIRRPDDWHLHLRDGDALRAVLPHTAAQFARAIVMPNLKPPVTTTAQALAYKQRILAALPAGSKFEPLMTLYLTDRTDPAEVDK